MMWTGVSRAGFVGGSVERGTRDPARTVAKAIRVRGGGFRADDEPRRVRGDYDVGVPRNVVTLSPRWQFFPSRRVRAAQKRVAKALAKRYRYRAEPDPMRIEIDFPKSKGRATAKDEVAAALDDLDPNWRRLFVIHPTENSLGRRRKRAS